jgi:DivIVA domain-containing protein
MKKTNLILESILNKKFATELSGYNATEVDKFLDLIVKDYETYKNEVDILEEKLNEKNNIIENRSDEIKTLKLEIDNLRTQLKESAKASNYELLKEIKKLNKTDDK